jgi:excinuclease ABC subunit C
MTQFRQWKLCSDYYFWLCKGRCHKASAPLESKDEYSQITTSIQKFFEWDIEYIENLIKSEIQQAIDKQYFERAAKLRDMLFHIDKVTETQRVILDPKINGYFFKIQLIWSRYVYVITKFFEWKLIDIITGKNPLALEGTLEAREQFLSSFTVEFWESLIPHNETFFYTKKQKKSTLQEIEKLSENLLENYIAKTSFEKENVMNDLLIELQARYHIKDFPYHIECIDISHLSGWRTSGWLSCFLGGIPHKYGYRRYKINCHPELVSGSPEDSRDTELNSAWRNNSDDYAALREVILRRFKKDETTGSPHLFILDWWKWQLSIISKIKKEFLEKKDNSHREKIFGTTTFISLGKWAARKRSAKSIGEQEEIFYFNQQGAICSQKLLYDQVDRILTHIRDEAHRFANNYRRKQMSDERK